MPRRPDAELVKTTKFHETEFLIMRKKTQSELHYGAQIDLTNTLKFLEKYNKDKSEEDKLTLFQIYLTAAVRAITLRPRINRFVSGRRLWQRNRIIISFVVKKDKVEGGDEINAMIEFDPFDTLASVQKIVNDHIHEARHGVNPNEEDIELAKKMPRWMLRLFFWYLRWSDEHNFPLYSFTKDIPMWSTIFLAHLGSIDVPAIYHHLFEFGTTGILITFGKMHLAQVVDQETGKVDIRKVMEIKVSIDDRIASGSYTGPTIKLMQDLIENPESLLNPPNLTDEQLDKLMLKKYKKERLEREKQRKKERKKNKKN
jgi:hypothetical protein